MRLGMGMEHSAPMIMDGEAVSSAYLSLALTAVDAEIADATASGSGRLTEAIIAVAPNMSVTGVITRTGLPSTTGEGGRFQRTTQPSRRESRLKWIASRI